MAADTVQIERRRNRVSNASFEINTSGWVPLGASAVVRSTARAYVGAASGLVTFGAGGPLTQGVSRLMSATPGTQYAASAYVWVPSGSLSGAPALTVEGVGQLGQPVAVADQWVRVEGVFTATGTTHLVSISNTATVTAGQTCNVDAVLFEEASTVGPYFDGSFPATGTAPGSLTYGWVGAVQATGSIEYELIPRFVITPTVEPATVPPRVRIDVTDLDTAATAGVTLTRVDPDGKARPVRTYDGGPLVFTAGTGGRVATLYDYEPPYGAPLTYSTAEAPTITSGQVTVPEDRVWLIHPGVPALSMPITVAKMGARTRPVTRGVYRPMGSRYPVVHTDGQRQAPEYPLTVRTTTLPELQQLLDLCDDAQVLLLNVPATKQWGVGAEYISVGDLSEDRLYQYGREPRRVFDLPCTVVDRPEGGTTASRTLASIAAEAPTLAGLAALYDTLYDMAMG